MDKTKFPFNQYYSEYSADSNAQHLLYYSPGGARGILGKKGLSRLK